jgi:hypothetical protein
VAAFMQMYPAYTLRTVLDEYAVSFFSLLNEGYRLQNHNYLMLAYIARAAGTKDEDFQKFQQQLEWASKHPGDILKSASNGSDPAKIKRLLTGR